jgi:3-oxoadipate enol-lactonase
VGLLVAAPLPALAEAVAAGLLLKPEQRHYHTEAVTRLSRNSKRRYLANLRAVAGFDVRCELGALRCPSLVVAGDRDRTVPRAARELLRRAIPGAQFALIRDSGHATPIDQTEEFNKVAMEFIGDGK